MPPEPGDDYISYGYAQHPLGDGRCKRREHGIQVQGEREPGAWRGCVATLVAIVCGLFGAKYVFDDLGWQIEGRRQGAKSFVLFVVVVLVPGWACWSLITALFERKIDREIPWSDLHRREQRDDGETVLWVEPPGGGKGYAVGLRACGPRSRAELGEIWQRCRSGGNQPPLAG